MPRVLFLPGAGGAAEFWEPVAQRLPAHWDRRLLSWPGLGAEPPDPTVAGVEDLVRMVLDRLDQPADLVAQSMGGYIALKTALAAPDKVRRLVLTGTSGGAPMADLNVHDWRPEYRAAYPQAAGWITQAREDLSARMPSVTAPALLLFGDADPIAPVALGERLQALLGSAELRIVKDGDHAFAHDRPDEVAPLIVRHLGGPAPA